MEQDLLAELVAESIKIHGIDVYYLPRESVNKDPYGAGWMIKIKMTNPSEIEGLLDAQAYESLIA